MIEETILEEAPVEEVKIEDPADAMVCDSCQ